MEPKIIREIGNLSELETSDKSSVVGAINENKNSIDNITPASIGAETPAGAQAKADTAEANAKAASVPTSRTVNGKALSSNISLTAADVGAVPTSRTVNGLALSSNITLNHNHVGAVNAIASGSSSADPNTTQEPYILTNHANSPDNSRYWHIHTYFYSSKTGNRAQQAIEYNPTNGQTRMFVRSYFSSWSAWKEVGGSMPVMVASNTLQESFNTERTFTSSAANSYMLVGKHIPKGTGEIKISMDLRVVSGGGFSVHVLSLPTEYFVSPYRISAGLENLSWQTNIGTVINGSWGNFARELRVYSSISWGSIAETIQVSAGLPIYIFLFSDQTGGSRAVRNLRFYYDVM